MALEDVEDLYETQSDPDAAFNQTDAADVEQTFVNWRTECDRADAIVSAHGLEDVGRHRSGNPVSLRWILNHMIEEYSRHNGHADLLRERIDGATGY